MKNDVRVYWKDKYSDSWRKLSMNMDRWPIPALYLLMWSVGFFAIIVDGIRVGCSEFYESVSRDLSCLFTTRFSRK